MRTGHRPGDDVPLPRSLSHRVPGLGAMVLPAVARHGGLGRAARDIGITQPAASSRIRSMERW